MEPSDFVAGDTVRWSRHLSDYKASDGWVLTYSARGVGQFSITASADGDAHQVTIPASTSAGYAPGRYKWIAAVSKAGERYTVDNGYFNVLPDLATASGYKDRILELQDHIDAINGFIGKNYKYSSYSIGGRSLSSHSISDLYLLRDRMKRDLNDLLNAEGIKRGSGNNKIVRVRISS